MTPSEVFVETMGVHVVTEIVCIMGSACMDAMDIFEPAGVHFISVLHEQCAAYTADGYSRVSGI
jgi:sulfoacetaldehyde acetyltransferase